MSYQIEGLLGSSSCMMLEVRVVAMLAGVGMLLTYPATQYGSALSVSECNAVIEQCITCIKSANNIQEHLEAVWTVLRNMGSSTSTNLPQPAISTYTLATQAVLESMRASSDVPTHDALVQLQQNVWQNMQTVLGGNVSTAPVYVPALLDLEAPDAVQTVLLMAQNGVTSLSFECCEALYLQLDSEQSEWVQSMFGAKFASQVEALAIQSDAKPDAMVLFPEHRLPQLSVSQLSDCTALFVLDDVPTPWWMRPSTAWSDHFAQDMTAQAAGGSDKVPTEAAKLTAAEELVLQFGHADRRQKKGRK